MTRWVALTLLVATASSAAGPIRRWALVAGENRGLGGDEALRYAESDAQHMRDALVEVGQVAPGDVVLLKGVRADSLRQALSSLKARLTKEANPTDRLTVYLSGHAGDGVLHLDDSELPLTELVDFVKQAPVEVGVLIVDACRSGSMTRLKGLKPLASAPVKVEASGLQGRVLISASGADEYAQESEALKGSTFTHHFVTGLRGAADSSHDGRVTLDEVYAWAWSRTIESTFGSRGGVQRPSFKVDLSGNGQLVLSEPGAAGGRLVIGVEAPGRWLVVNAETQSIFAELDKPTGPLTLVVPPGGYRLQLKTDSNVLERAVIVPATGDVVVSGGDLERASQQTIALKGAAPSSVTLSAGAAVASGIVNGVSIQPGAELRFRVNHDFVWILDELTLALLARDGRGAASGFRQTELELRFGVAHRFFISRLSLSLGLELGPILSLQSELPDRSSRTSLGLTGDLQLEARLPIVRPLELYVLLTGGGAVVKKSVGVVPVPRIAGSAGVALTF